MMKQKKMLLMTVMVLAVTMTACGQKAEQASEQVPSVEEETAVCEQNGHIWIEATCSMPKTCSVCGEMVGKALEHTVTTEATYLQGVTCDVCGTVVGEPLQPVASEEDISNLQIRMDALVETYNTGNQAAVDRLAEYVIESQDPNKEEDTETLVQDLDEILGGNGDMAWYNAAIPMAFYNNMNEGLLGEYSFEDYLNTTANTINDYLAVAQEDKNNMFLSAIMLWNTMPYIKEIATNSPTVLDIVYYKESQPVAYGMGIKSIGYGVVEVNGKLFIADLLSDNKVINLYPEDSGYSLRPLPNTIESEEYDDTLAQIITGGDMEYSIDDEGILWCTAKNPGDTLVITYKGYIGSYKWIQAEEDEETNSLPSSGDEAYKMAYFPEG